MNCPICHIRLMPADRGQVEIDFCPKCWGVWLDGGELDAILRADRINNNAIVPIGTTTPHPSSPTATRPN